jgi:putative Ca2+/H+ antiporter (TMEM165/GDT1 family)/putative Mn2+ efflux pump MntP
MAACVASLLFVTLAEMGDKTQLLAMAFATKFRARTVLLGVCIATLLNHALAVAAGRVLVSVIPLESISLMAALSFILFGLWTLRGDTLEGEDERRSRLGPLATVAIGFFLAELGDKTQLATISLAVKYENPVGVLFGTTSGMLVADSLGIGIGIVLGKRLPDAAIRWASAGIFVLFGFAGVTHVLGGLLPLAPRAAVLFLLAAGTLAAIHSLALRRAAGRPWEPHWRTLPRWAYLAMLGMAWLSGLGRLPGLAAVDHWMAFLILVALGWITIHGAVRRARGAFETSVRSAIVVLAAWAAVQALRSGLPWSLAAVPLLLLLLAASVQLCPAALLGRAASARVRRVWERRGDLASGLTLFAIAALILLRHLG